MTTSTPTYRAQTDPTTKKWHAGTAAKGTTSLCGVRLIETADTRAFAVKVPEAERHMETSDDLTRVDCGACKRNREYRAATGAGPAVPATRTSTRRSGSAARATLTEATREGGSTLSAAEAAEMAGAAAERNGDAAKPPSQQARRPKRQSRTDKAQAAQAKDRAKLAAAADATVAGIDAALAADAGAPAPVADGTPGPALPTGETAEQRDARHQAKAVRDADDAAQRKAEAATSKAASRRGKPAKTGHPRADRAANAERLLAPEADLPGSAAGHRAEADTCERGTPGCSVRHTRDSECATW